MPTKLVPNVPRGPLQALNVHLLGGAAEQVQEQADKGWSDISAGRYDDVTDEALPGFVAQLGEPGR